MYKFKPSQKIAFSAMFAAICIVMKFIKFPAFGMEISFSYIPNFLAGIFLGPVYGMIVGCAGDILGTVLKGLGLSPLITIGNTLIGGIMGFVFKYSYVKKIYLKIIAGAFCVLVIVTYGINTVAMILPPINRFPFYFLALANRLPQGFILAFNTALVLVIYAAVNKAFFEKYKE